NKPFRDLHWFTRADAEIFFGRGEDIRKLYDLVTGPDTPPILLTYGQTGVGKSSILDAGLIPRLERDYAICYLRRDKNAGLLGTLKQAFLPEECKESLSSAWGNAETRLRKPVVLILDQVEEAYTHANDQLPDEMSQFLKGLEDIFSTT